MPSGETAIEVVDLWKEYTVIHDRPQNIKDAVVRKVTSAGWRREKFWALRGVTLSVAAGEALGVIGANGSGKSSLLGLLGRVLRPTRGELRVNGRVSILMEAGVGFHPELTGIENIYLSGALLGMRRAEITERLDAIVEFSELSEFVDAPVRTFSSGMTIRLGFAVSVHVQPDVLLVDEVLAVGDEAFHQKCYAKLDELRTSGTAIVFVSHDMRAVRRLCPQAVWLAEGTIQGLGPTEDIVEQYLQRVGQTDPRD